MKRILMGLIIGLALSGAAQGQQYDLLFKGGHVIDPANHIDEARDVAIQGGRIAAVEKDIVLDKVCEENQEKCSGDKIIANCFPKGISLNYEIDCRKRKTILVEQINNFTETGVKIKYDNFRHIDKIYIPGIVEFKDSQYNATIKIKLLKVDFTWNGSVKFVPGKGYELIELV